ncbi:hypothetical protein [Hymenobacter sublimis]|uniref:Uncharacterized protein n=1 Tax=Hymenobacter sublimis TaxID=2933777 RepID=A0ABY4JF47_9BACT|nr:hypothetical protein [Hymenobacter sublimis]UPL50517.1 hypothetical protein MWH26_06320 [Hymenobacter sublimis]
MDNVGTGNLRWYGKRFLVTGNPGFRLFSCHERKRRGTGNEVETVKNSLYCSEMDKKKERIKFAPSSTTKTPKKLFFHFSEHQIPGQISLLP